MSFGITAVGTAKEIVAQLDGQTMADDLGHAVTALVTEAMAAAVNEDAPPGEGREARFVVEASGHSGGGALTELHLTIRPYVVPVPEPVLAAEGAIPRF